MAHYTISLDDCGQDAERKTEFCRYQLNDIDFMNAINLRVFDTVYSRLGSSPPVASDAPLSYGYAPESANGLAAENPQN